ncbi:hypothetical protein EU805_14765 [Salipiger sp. IMCC34102]|uniref:hypothetical protein n=1 Tax=Salipiger sp. IMCC34102 TaxID=2510647 RepID=UPI00101D3622|nr:hypothetical protein [Salipiger sp. IMCC34102]RYH01252.1 hypothetical protein EU805_14765 [Salipiger sp. IMCC34102]
MILSRKKVLAGLLGGAGIVVLSGAGLRNSLSWRFLPAPETTFTPYAGPSPAHARGRRVFHLGHSLVGRDMPAMLAQLAGGTHRFDTQIGWGTSLKAHWEEGTQIPGFDPSDPHARSATEALADGTYDAFVLTEMVEIRDAIRYHDSAAYLARWIERARADAPRIEIFLYETWHWLDHPDGWLDRIDHDLDRYWLHSVLGRALDRIPAAERPAVHLIPGGQVMAAVVRRIEAGETGGTLSDRTDLFAKHPDGTQDSIHFNDHGAYLIALTHCAVLYARSPEGLPHDLRRADGTPMTPLSAQDARLMQRVVWDVVSGRYVT